MRLPKTWTVLIGPPLLLLTFTCLSFADDRKQNEDLDFSEAAAVLREAIQDGAFPGCAVAVGNDKGPLWTEGFGSFEYDGTDPVRADTIYDLASVTKAVATTATLMRLSVEGKLDVGAPVTRYIPEFAEASADEEQQAWRTELTVEDLLKHRGGLPSWKPFYRSVNSYDDLLASLMETPLEAEPGSRYRYSDLGFILLGEIASRAGGRPLAELEQDLVFGPLGMDHTLRSPPRRWHSRIPPTERDPDGDGFVRGIVHDENARAGGGGTGHAGLFSTAGDLSLLAGELLRASRQDSDLFPPEIFEKFTARASDNVHRALGWSLASGRGSAGRLLSRQSFGHNGFTGTSVWIDPENNLYVILLTNRVHPTRDNGKISRVRPRLANAVARALDVEAP